MSVCITIPNPSNRRGCFCDKVFSLPTLLCSEVQQIVKFLNFPKCRLCKSEADFFIHTKMFKAGLRNCIVEKKIDGYLISSGPAYCLDLLRLMKGMIFGMSSALKCRIWNQMCAP